MSCADPPDYDSENPKGDDCFDRPDGGGQEWRDMISAGKTDEFWLIFLDLVRSEIGTENNVEERALDLFLRFLKDGRFSRYLDENWSDDQIRHDLLSAIK